MPHQCFLDSRAACSCCGYLTLEQGADFEICQLCDWEDDGQDDADAEEVRGGPNADYSLSEARKNFGIYRTMYSPDRDERLLSLDSPLVRDTKELLVAAFDDLRLAPTPELECEILRLEKVLQEELTRRVREYERRNARGA